MGGGLRGPQSQDGLWESTPQDEVSPSGWASSAHTPRKGQDGRAMGASLGKGPQRLQAAPNLTNRNNDAEGR